MTDQSGRLTAAMSPPLWSIGPRPVLVRRAGVIALMAVLVLYQAWMIRELGMAEIDGTTYFLLDDDIMISMRYAKNLAAGVGLVYNPGERVEGFTNPLLTFFAAGLHLLPAAPPTLSLGLMLINLGFSLGILYVLARFWGDTTSGIAAGLFSALFYVTLPNHSWHSHAGYEVYMLIAVLLFVVWRFEQLRVGDALVLALLPLTHSIAMQMWMVLIVLILLLKQRSLKQRVVLVAVAFVPFVSYELFRILYYHDIVPNTARLKVGAGSLTGGLLYLKGWLRMTAPLILLALYTLFTQRDKKTMLLGVLLVVHTATVVILGGDIFFEYRFLFPCSVLLTALAGKGIATLLSRAAALPRRELAYAVVLLSGTLMYTTVWLPIQDYRTNAEEFQVDKRWQIRAVALGLAVKENTAPDAVVALFGLGHTGYYSERAVIDMLGKADSHIARTQPTPNRHIGHSKTDFDYVMNRSPDYVQLGIPPCRLSDEKGLQRQSKIDQFGYTADLALHPTFRAAYRPSITDRSGRFVPFQVKAANRDAVWRLSEDYYRNLEPYQTACGD